MFKHDIISGLITVTRDSINEVEVEHWEVEGLERLAVWDPEHVEDRIRDHYNGVQNIWVESLRLKL